MNRSFLPPVPAGWRKSPLKHACQLNPEVLPESTPGDTELEYVDIAALEGGTADMSPKTMSFSAAPSRARRVLRSGDTILSTVRTYLKAVATFPTVESTLIASTGFAVIRPNGRLHARFAYWAVLSAPFIESVVAHSEGVSYPAINPSVLGSLNVVLPPTSQQERIANFLDEQTARIDALIAEKRRLSQRLVELRTASIRAMCLGGVECPPDDRIAEWRGSLPIGWRSPQLRHCLLPVKGAMKTGPFGSQLTAADMAGGTVKVYNQRSVITNDFTGGDEYISEAKFRELSSFETFPGDVLVTTRGTIGRAAALPLGSERGILHPCLLRVQCDQNLLRPQYLVRLLQDSGLLLAQLAHLSDATTIEVIYSGTMAGVRLPLPPVHIQDKILGAVSRVDESIDALKRHVTEHIDRLREYRSSLISAAVTGQLDIGAYREAA